MTSRERVQKAVNFQEPDRVPVDLGGMKASGICAYSYKRLREHAGLPAADIRIWDPRFMIALVDEDIRKRFHIDVLPLDIENALWDNVAAKWVAKDVFGGDRFHFPPGTKIGTEDNGDLVLLNPDNTPTSYRMPKGGFYFDDTEFDKYGGSFKPEHFSPAADIPDETLRIFSSYASKLHRDTPYALLGWGFGVCFLGLSLITNRRDNVTLGRPSDWLMMLMTEKDTCHEMMAKSVDASIKCLSLVKEAVGDRAFAWGVAADDSGTQRGEFINPQLWAEMIKPHYKKLCGWIHANTPWKTFFHCCGSIYNLIPHLIEAGIDILNPVQTSAVNMAPRRIKEKFGDRLVLWGGGCDTQNVLGSSSPEEIKEHVRERMEIFSPGAGYVFNQVHNIQANVPAENIASMLDSAYRFGAY